MNSRFTGADVLEPEIFRDDDLSGGMGHDLLTFGLLLYLGRVGPERYIRSEVARPTL